MEKYAKNQRKAKVKGDDVVHTLGGQTMKKIAETMNEYIKDKKLKKKLAKQESKQISES